MCRKWALDLRGSRVRFVTCNAPLTSAHCSVMEIRAFAEQILLQPELDRKLAPPTESLTDLSPGDAMVLTEPARTPDLRFAPRRTAPKMPAFGAFSHPEKRGLAHHIMANHELQALEVMAWVLLAFPEAPPSFRAGLAGVMRDEQRHTRMHASRARALGVPFGSRPVNCYIWKKAMSFTGVLDYLAGLPLVFEAANLDHSIEMAEAFEAAGDPQSAAIMRQIHLDEIEHVRFGLHWLQVLKPEHLTPFQAFEQHLHWPLRPCKARGTVFQREARKEAGMDDEFINAVEAASDEKV